MVKPLQGSINFSAEGTEEVLQNVRVILATRKGEVPLDRTFGVAWNMVDEPRPLATQRLKAEVIEEIEDREPRATVEAVRFEETGSEGALAGRLRPIVELSIDENA